MIRGVSASAGERRQAWEEGEKASREMTARPLFRGGNGASCVPSLRGFRRWRLVFSLAFAVRDRVAGLLAGFLRAFLHFGLASRSRPFAFHASCFASGRVVRVSGVRQDSHFRFARPLAGEAPSTAGWALVLRT